jgi:hypothetical protein
MGRLGHANPAAALPYQHATADRDRVLAEALSALVNLTLLHPANCGYLDR